MAGFLLVAPRGAQRGLVALALLAASALTLAAQAPMMQAATPPPAATPAPATTPPGTQPAAGAKPAPIIPPVPVDYFQRYGKILSPGTEASHPLKLAMPNPDVGQIKIPTGEETALRDKIERLTTMSDEDIRKDLANWPAFKQMSLADEGAMLVRIQQFKDHRAKLAQECAHDLGLLTLSPAQMDRFTQEYWQKRLKLDGDLARQFQPIYQARESKMEEELFREYSTPAKPPLTKPVVVKKPATPGVPTTPATPMPAPNPMVADPSVATPAQPMH
jgi:hypothetical protein